MPSIVGKRSVTVDSSALIALFDASDRNHVRAAQYFGRAKVPFVTNVAVLTEVTHLLAFSPSAVRECLTWLTDSFTIDRHTADDLPRIIEIMAKYADLPADFADASLMALCERSGLGHIATFDSDFDVYRRANGKPLINVFATL